MQPKIDFIVIDTEGNPYLNEIAIINSSGQLIYEAFAREHLNFNKLGTLGQISRTIPNLELEAKLVE